MALSNSEARSAIFLRLKGSTEDKPAFKRIAKMGDSYEEIDSFDTIEGTLAGIEFREYEYEGEKKTKAVLNMHDGDEQYKVDIHTGSSMGISILNSLLSADSLAGKLRISVYKKDKYNNAYVELNGQKLPWKLDLDEQAKFIDKVKFKGKDISDKTRLEEHIVSLVKSEIPQKIDTIPSQHVPSGVERPSKKGELLARNEKFDDGGEDDLPF
jgi:hypothetical protein